MFIIAFPSLVGYTAIRFYSYTVLHRSCYTILPLLVLLKAHIWIDFDDNSHDIPIIAIHNLYVHCILGGFPQAQPVTTSDNNGQILRCRSRHWQQSGWPAMLGNPKLDQLAGGVARKILN